jgi:hypothetical protein
MTRVPYRARVPYRECFDVELLIKSCVEAEKEGQTIGYGSLYAHNTTAQHAITFHNMSRHLATAQHATTFHNLRVLQVCGSV